MAEQANLVDAHPGFSGLIGVARRDITPPKGIYSRNWGAAKHDIAEGVHRPLTCTALALREASGGDPLVILALDLGWWQGADDEWFVRGGVLDALGLDPSRLVVSVSHTHAGPAIFRGLADKPGGHLIVPYQEQVRDASIAAAREAIRSLKPATLEWESGHCSLARNRDLADPAKPRWLCGYNPGEPADTTVLVGRACDERGAPLATLVNYACHPTTLAWENRLISPDYVGAMRETVESATGGAPCLFLLGCCGELGPREGFTGDVAVADANGRMLGLSVQAVLAAMLPPATAIHFTGAIESGAPLAAWGRRPAALGTKLIARRFEYRFQLKPLPSGAELDAQIAECTDRVMAERLRRRRAVRSQVGDGTSTTVSALAWRLGDAALLSQSQEAYSLLQRELRRRTAAPLAVLNLSTGVSLGYLPPRESYDRDLYQVWQTPFAAGSLEHAIEQCATAVATLFEDATARAGAGR
jgi:hypothetical protein